MADQTQSIPKQFLEIEEGRPIFYNINAYDPHAVVREGCFKFHQRVRKTKGSSWQGRVVGFYSTSLTPIGYCVESEREPGSVQLYPESALEAVDV